MRARAIRALCFGFLAMAGGSIRPAPAWAQTMEHANYLFVMIDEVEQAPSLGERPVLLEAQAWYGGDYDRLWVKLSGEASTRESGGHLEAQALFSRLVSPWWDLQAGVRVDHAWGGGGRTRPHLALGIQGLAPYWFEVESAVFVDVDGDVSAQLSAAYDLLLSQSLILEPQLEVGVSFQDVPEWGIGSGVHDLGIGVRLRYEIIRELAPYVGYLWKRAFGGTANALAGAGAPYREGSLVLGLRAWY